MSRKGKKPYMVTNERIKLAVIANCRAGGNRKWVMTEIVRTNGGSQENLEEVVVELVEKKIANGQNSQRLLRFLLSIKNEHLALPKFMSRRLMAS